MRRWGRASLPLALGVGVLAGFPAPTAAAEEAPDTRPPALRVTLNDIPDDMNRLLVVPPDGFRITIAMDARGGSPIDPDSLSITSLRDLGPHPAGTELAPLFERTPRRAWWEVPAGSDLERATHGLTVRVSDEAGNEAERTLLFAVRDFAAGPPLGNLQRVFLDFDTDRSLAPGVVDFVEDLREFGLSSPADPVLEGYAFDTTVARIVERVAELYGAGGDDPVNVAFSATDPGAPHTRLCVGGESSLGPEYLGASTLDRNNLIETGDECARGASFGVFPQAIDDLWGDDPGYASAFHALDPEEGGTPFGEHPLDGVISASTWDLWSAPRAEVARAVDVIDAFEAFTRIVATAIAHEYGHTLGLSAPGPLPGGLYGGRGALADHNVTPDGATPEANHVMNAGASFRFDQITGRGGQPPPAFRALSWAYLHDRIALNDDVGELLPPVVLRGVEPTPVVVGAGEGVPVTFRGENFVDPPIIELLRDGEPLPAPVFRVVVADAQTATGVVHGAFLTAGRYDVRLINGDGQEHTLEGGLEVELR